MPVIRIEVVREKAGCRDDCTLEVTADGNVTHNGTNWHYDLTKYMDPEYPGPGWLSVAMETIAAQHEKALPGRRRK